MNKEDKEEKDLTGPVFAVEVADDAIVGLDGGEEVLLGEDLGVVAVAEGDPTAPLLSHLLHLLEPPFSERLQIVESPPNGSIKNHHLRKETHSSPSIPSSHKLFFLLRKKLVCELITARGASIKITAKATKFSHFWLSVGSFVKLGRWVWFEIWVGGGYRGWMLKF
ncbi:hypothetical protein CMV_001006 [Castanea mollissima]|uniref:Uncharacterized protein n=1 Tax=Castanea mollissima TaxID=60419 RepID=A0A8J4RSB0_9ROSI|nr:hypothetical protein CMV_001006 [Castanea mollissima]